MNLKTAIELNDLEKVNQLIKNGVDINKRFENGDTPLGYAVGLYRPQIVELLIKWDVNVNGLCENDELPLAWAARHVRNEIKDMLMKAGAKAY